VSAPNTQSMPAPARAARFRSLTPLLFEQTRTEMRRRHAVAAIAAIALYSLVLSIAAKSSHPDRVRAPLMQVELTAPALPKPPAPPPERLPPPPEPPAPSRQAQSAPVAATGPSRAGKVLAAAEEAPSAQPAGDIVTGDAPEYQGGAVATQGQGNGALEEKPEPVTAPPPPPPPRRLVDAVAVTRAYLSKVRDALARGKRYPLAAQRLGLSGTVVVSFAIDEIGRFTRVLLVRSSGNDLLDKAATETVLSLSQKIPRPVESGTVELPLRTAIRFEIGQ